MLQVFQQRYSALASARFDLAGALVDRTADIDVSSGLHHHGDDPDQAGYTLGEVLHLARR